MKLGVTALTWVTRLRGQRDIQGNRLHWAILGFTRLFWTQWTVQGCLDCNGLYWAVLGCKGMCWTLLGSTGQ